MNRIDAVVKNKDRILIREADGGYRRVAWIEQHRDGTRDVCVSLLRHQRGPVVNRYSDEGPIELTLLCMANQAVIPRVDSKLSEQALREMAHLKLDELRALAGLHESQATSTRQTSSPPLRAATPAVSSTLSP